MNRVELAVVRVVGIESEADEAVRKTVVGRELVEQSRVAAAPVEIEVRRELSGLAIINV